MNPSKVSARANIGRMFMGVGFSFTHLELPITSGEKRYHWKEEVVCFILVNFELPTKEKESQQQSDPHTTSHAIDFKKQEQLYNTSTVIFLYWAKYIGT